MRIPPVLVLIGLLAASVAPGCAMEREAVVGATKTAGRATVKAAEAGVKVVSWPVRKLWELEPRSVGTATASAKPPSRAKPASPETPEFSGDKVIVAGGVAPPADDADDPDDPPRRVARRSNPRTQPTRDADTRMADRSRNRDRDAEADLANRDPNADADWHTAKGKTRAVAADLDTDPIVIR